MDDREYNLALEKLKLSKISTGISLLIPILLIIISFTVKSILNKQNAQYDRDAQVLQEKQKHYSVLGKHLNNIFTYTIDVGSYRQFTPIDIIEKKRAADTLFFTYRPYWSEKTETKYIDFMKAAFDTCIGSGKRANIRATTTEKKNAFKIDNKTWKPEWDSRFSPKDPNVTDKYSHRTQ